MNPTGVSLTSASLLFRVRAQDEAAWRRLVELYTPLAYRWARQCGLQGDDAADVVQEVFLAVATHIGDFSQSKPGSTFRGWLWTITRNQVRLYFRRREQRPLAVGGSAANHLLQEQPELLEQDDEPTGFDSRRSLVHRALGLIEQDFAPATWRVFWRQVVDGESAVDLAAELGLTSAAVRQAKYRVLCRLQEELERC